jgi:hypothetical protein
VPPFHGEEHLGPCGPSLHFKTIDDARAALSMLDGRAGPGGETLHVGLLRLPAVHPNRGGGEHVRCRSSIRDDSGEMISEEECLDDKWEGLGLAFRTGGNVVEGVQDVEHREVVTRSSCVGGGCETWRTGLLIGCQVRNLPQKLFRS